MANLIEAIPVSSMTATGKKWKVKILEGDKQGSSAFYPKEVLESNVGKFQERARIYLDHPTADDEHNRPERTARDIIGYVENGVFEGKDIFGEANIFSDWQEWVKERAEAGVIGLSIRASGELDESGSLKSFSKVHSVDLVTTPGAGGGFKTVLESAKPNSATTSVADSPKKEEIMELPKELLEALDALVQGNKANAEALGKLTERAAKEDADKATAIAEAAKEAAPKAPTFAEIDKALNEAELPVSARATVLAAVEAGAVLAEAVAAKKAEVEAMLAEVGTFKGFAADDKGVDFKEAAKTAVSGIYGN